VDFGLTDENMLWNLHLNKTNLQQGELRYDFIAMKTMPLPY
jgi:hypothetical protein